MKCRPGFPLWSVSRLGSPHPRIGSLVIKKLILCFHFSLTIGLWSHLSPFPSVSTQPVSTIHLTTDQIYIEFICFRIWNTCTSLYLQGVLKRAERGRSLQIPYFLDFFWCFGLFLTIQYRRFFILVLLGHLIEKKVEKSHSPKRLNFRVGSN